MLNSNGKNEKNIPIQRKISKKRDIPRKRKINNWLKKKQRGRQLLFSSSYSQILRLNSQGISKRV